MKTKSFVLLIAALVVVGCASKGTIVTTQPLAAKTSDFKTMLINISSQVPGAEMEKTKLESMLVSTLRQNRKFEKVIAGSVADAEEVSVDLHVNVTILKLRRVNSGDRVMVGALAGRAKLVCDVELVNAADSTKIGAFRAQGKSSGGSVFAKGTDQAIRRAAEKIIEYINKNL